VIGSPGFLADAVTLQKHLHARHVMYQHNHGRPMSCPAMAQARAHLGRAAPRRVCGADVAAPRAQLLSNTLYYKRFFPYYAFNICAGLDTEGAPLPLSVGGSARPGSLLRACPRAV